MRRTSTVTMYTAAVILTAAGILMAIVGDTWSGKSPLSPKLGINATQSPAPADVNLAERLGNVYTPASTVSPSISVFWVTKYTSCDHEIVREEEPEQIMIGKTLEQFARSYPDYEMSIAGGQIRMERSINQYCPDHYIIKSDSTGSIYVYRNMTGQDYLTMVTKVNFPADAVPDDYKPLLEEGMAFGSIEEIEGLIEDAES